MKRTSWSSTAFVISASLCLWWWGTDGLQAFTSETARRVAVMEDSRPISDLPLQNQLGDTVSLSDFEGKLVLVDFIYTQCPDVCHALGFQFKTLLETLEQEKLSDEVMLLSISFDPVNDNPEQLQAYLNRYIDSTEKWQSVRTLDPEQLSLLLKQFGVVVLENDRGGFDHNAAIHLLDQQRHLVGIFDFSANTQIVDAIKRRLVVKTI